MRPADFGPVPVSRFKVDAGRIYDALESGRRVLVSRRGEVVAVVDPAEALEPHLLMAYVMPGRRNLAELTASEINRGSPSRAVADAAAGVPRYVTKDAQVYGILRGVTAEELADELPSAEEIAAGQSRIDEYMQDHPEATAVELAALTASGAEAVGAPDLQATSATSQELVSEVNDLAETVDRLSAAISTPAYGTVGVEAPPRSVSTDLRAIVEIATTAAAQVEAVLRSAADVEAGSRSQEQAARSTS